MPVDDAARQAVVDALQSQPGRSKTAHIIIMPRDVVLPGKEDAAAVRSLATGLSSTLVGIMVAVALPPPAATPGMMLGSGQFDLALGASLLLAVNVVCITPAAKLMSLLK